MCEQPLNKTPAALQKRPHSRAHNERMAENNGGYKAINYGYARPSLSKIPFRQAAGLFETLKKFQKVV